MSRSSVLPIGLLLLVLLSSLAARDASARDFAQRHDDTAPPAAFAAALDRAAREHAARKRASPAATDERALEIDVVFHVISGPALEGDVPEPRLVEQLAVVNDAFAPAGLRFKLKETRRYRDSPYFPGKCYPTTEDGIRMKQELAVAPATTVNIYTCELALPHLAGFSTLPNEFAEDDARHGVVVDYGTLPGSAAPLDRGHTLVHELGHYFGLLHTFYGGCSDTGDSVSDTPAEASPSYGCAYGRDTCPQAGADPVTNFMDYSDDACMEAFTPLQNERMRALLATFRPSLGGDAFAIGPGITGNWYSPQQSGHGFSVEVLDDDVMVAQWYTFAPDGGAAWIVASGPIVGNRAALEAFQVEGDGARFPPDFDATRVTRRRWGTLAFEFESCEHGTASWEPVIAGYRSGSLALTRLTVPAGLACAGDGSAPETAER